MCRQSSPITTLASRTPPTGKLGHSLDNRSSTSNFPRPHGGFHHHPSGLIPPDGSDFSIRSTVAVMIDYDDRPPARPVNSALHFSLPLFRHIHPQKPKTTDDDGCKLLGHWEMFSRLATRSWMCPVEGSNFTHVTV